MALRRGTGKPDRFLCFETAPSPGGGIVTVVLNGRTRRRAMLVAVAVLSVAGAFASSAESTPLRATASSTGGVFVVTYAPQLVTSRDSLMRVRFTTTGRAQPGWEYYVRLVIRQPKAKKLKCATRAASWVPGMVRRVQHISGVPGGNYTVWPTCGQVARRSLLRRPRRPGDRHGAKRS